MEPLPTGNNPTLSSEIARRTVRIRLDAKRDRPWLRDRFRHPDLRQWVSAHRHELVAAALTLVRTWIATDKPDPTGSSALGMFESWSRVTGGILQVAGVPGFLSNLSDFYESTDTEGEMVRGDHPEHSEGRSPQARKGAQSLAPPHHCRDLAGDSEGHVMLSGTACHVPGVWMTRRGLPGRQPGEIMLSGFVGVC